MDKSELKSENTLSAYHGYIKSIHNKVEKKLGEYVGHLSYEEIKRRCQRITIHGSMVEEYFLDDKLLFSVDFNLIPPRIS